VLFTAFLPKGAMLAWCIAIIVCLCVYLLVFHIPVLYENG